MTTRVDAAVARMKSFFWLGVLLAWVTCTSGCSCRTEADSANSATTDGTAPTEPAAPDDTPLSVVVVDDAALAEAIRKQWSAISEQPLDLRELAASSIAAGEFGEPADVWIYPEAWLGTLVEQRIVGPIPPDAWNGRALDRRAMLPLARKVECVWGETAYAVPLGAPVVSLLYRADIFERLNLSPPRTWAEYQTLSEKLSDRAAIGDLAPPESEAWAGSLEPLQANWAGAALLIRAACYARHQNQYSTLFDFATMKPLIDGPPYVRALEELVAAAGANPGVALEMDMDAVRREVIAGRAAMGIAWPSRAESPARMIGLGVAPVPGDKNVFNAGRDDWETRADDDPLGVPVLGLSGRLGSVSRGTSRVGSAANFLTLLANADWSVGVLAVSAETGPSRTSQVKTLPRWLGEVWEGDPVRQYGQVIEAAHASPTWLMTLRIPGRNEYMAALDDAVRAAVRSEATPREALQTASSNWQAITERLGQETQRAAYRRSLGLAK